MANAKGILSLIVAFLLCLFLTISATAQDNRGIFVSSERLALVIGNNAYQAAPLRNPVNDAEDMGRVLSTLGFKVILQKNVDRRAMEDSIRSFGRQLRNGGVGLFYFAGHGMQVEGRNYLIPVNARIESESDIKYEAVDAGLVLGKMEDAKNQLNIVVLDACRNNPFSRNFRNTELGLARMDAPKGALIAYSTAPGEVAADGPERNGVFTKHLIRHMRTPNLPVEQVLKRVRIDVATETIQRQIPWESSSLMGDFYFIIEKVPEITGRPPPAALLTPPKESLASIPTSETKISPDSVKKQNLAIFPMYFSYRHITEAQLVTHYNDSKRLAVESLNKVLANNQNFIPLYSHYELNKKFNYKRFDSEILKEIEEDQLWVKDRFFDKESKLNINHTIQIGKKLNVDVVYICQVKVHDIDMYLIELNPQKVFLKNCQYNILSSYTEVPKCIDNFFGSYKEYKIE